jgi:hypothetical protein
LRENNVGAGKLFYNRRGINQNNLEANGFPDCYKRLCCGRSAAND